MSIEEVRSPVERWRAAGQRYGEAVLIETWRSAPRRPGARFVRSEGGEIGGNVSAGCVEADLAERLAGVIAGGPPGVVTYDVSDEAAHGVGLACGGRIDVYLRARGPDDPVWPVLLDRLDARATVLLLTAIEPPDAGSWLVAPDATVLAAETDRPPPPAAVQACRELLDTGGVRVVEGEGPAAEAPATLVEVLLPPRRLIVVGATPVGAALARLARAGGLSVEVIEPRPAYAAALEDADVEVDGRWPDEVLGGRTLDRSTAVAVVAHEERLDVAALAAALATEAGYVGLMGGGRTRRARFAALRETGIEERRIEAIRAPIGLDIGAERPPEIAVAILAELIGHWRGAT